MYKKRSALWVATLFITTLACNMQGLFPLSSAGPLDANSLSTIVAGTANAAAMQTAQANPSTSTPLPTSTKTATLTPIATSSPQVSTEGTSLVKQSDGSYVFTDYQGGYSIIVPSVWRLAVRINEQEFMNAQISPANSDPQIQRSLSLIQKDDPKEYRLFALDTSTSDLQTGFVSNMTVFWDRNDRLTIEQIIANAKKALPKTPSSLKITYADMGTTSTHLPMGIIEQSTTETTTSKQIITFYQKMILFKLKSGTLTLIMSTATQIKDNFVPGFDLMTDQIKMLP